MVQINELLGNSKLVTLISFLANNLNNEFTYTEIKKRTKLAKATLTKWLSYLEKNNFVFKKQIGLNKLYRINADNNVIKQFKILSNLLNLKPLEKLAGKHQFKAYLFGSAARGEDAGGSDYDILIIGDISREKIIADIRGIAKRLKKEVKLQIFTKKEWFDLREKDPAFYERVEKDKILLP